MRAISVSAQSVIGKATPIVAIVTTAAPGARNTTSTITAITRTVSSSTRPIRFRISVPCSILAGVTPVTPTGAPSGRATRARYPCAARMRSVGEYDPPNTRCVIAVVESPVEAGAPGTLMNGMASCAPDRSCPRPTATACAMTRDCASRLRPAGSRCTTITSLPAGARNSRSESA
jgi:hypothetical protein